MLFSRLTHESDILSLINWHSENSDFAVLDVETSSVNPREAKLFDIQISGRGQDDVVIIEGKHAKMLPMLAPRVVLVGHNYKYDAHVLFKHGVDLLNREWRDTLLMGHLVDENRESYSLDSYVQEMWQDGYKKVFWEKYKTYEEAPEEDKVPYACKDIYYTRALFQRLLGDLRGQEIPDTLVEHIHRLQASLLRTEIEGVKVDLEYLTDLGIKFKTEIERLKPLMRREVELQCQLWEMINYEKDLAKRKTEKGKLGVVQPVFSFDSPKQLSWLLYSGLGLPEQRNEKTKAVSVDDGSLSKIGEAHKVIPLVQGYRGYQKVFSSFIEGTRERLEHGRIYPEFRVSGTATGRISHANPNLGQLPREGGVRGVYIPSEGHVLISADYSQLEVCIEANLTGDVSLARIFSEGLSKHDITAHELKIDRNAAKTLNFCLQYWGTHFKVAKLLGVSLVEGLKIWNDYWRLYSGPKALKAKTDAAVDAGQPLRNLYGRKRRFEHKKRNPWDGDYRQAYNFLIQGTGADITSRAFYLTSEELSKRSWGRGLFSIHDELLIEAKKENAEEAEALMLETMVKVGYEIGLKIPLKADSSGLMSRWRD